MKTVNEQDILLSIFEILLPDLEPEILKKLAVDEYLMVINVINTIKRFQISQGDLISVLYFAAVEAIKKYDALRNIPITSYIKFITRLRIKDTIRKWGSHFETNHFIENMSISNANVTTYDYNLNAAAIEIDKEQARNLACRILLKQYCQKSANKLKAQCAIMIFQQYTVEEIRSKLKLSRRQFEAMRDEFHQYARNHWNYDNIY